MDNETKIHLSSFETELLNNAEWILTKNNILKKTQSILERLQENISDYTALHRHLFPSQVIAISPKVSKGENYKGLPWLMLDYPRYFGKEGPSSDQANIFAIRTMFWWANFFSTTLHLSGIYKQEYHPAIIHHYEDLCKNEYYYCVSSDQWHHHFEKENYLRLNEFTKNEFIELMREKPFIKLSRRFLLTEWENAIKLLSEEFVRIVGYLG
jgi:hypothetical protein